MSAEMVRKIIADSSDVHGDLADLMCASLLDKFSIEFLSGLPRIDVKFGIGKKEETYPISLVTGERMTDDAK